jgi:hypothetical protein
MGRPTPLLTAPPLALLALMALLVLLAQAATACAPSVVPANGTSPLDAIGDQCAVEPETLVVADVGDVPIVITSTHAGDTAPLGCSAGETTLRAIEGRTCDPARHDACVSGPCRAGGGDGNARLITYALVEELGRCLGGRPHLALTEMSRSLVDMNRDAHDPAGPQCALDDDAALPYWESYHRAIENAVALATTQAEKRGAHALLIDVHTYVTLPAAPPPAVMLGTGAPFGTTLPSLSVDDPALSLIFGTAGLRARLRENLAPIAANASVLPASKAASLDGLFAGRYVVHRYARVVPGETQGAGPAIDAIQIEISSGLRDDAVATAEAIARAVCDSFGARLGAGASAKPNAGRERT